MAVEIDVYGSCVCRDIFRYAQHGKYKVRKSVGYIPITSLYDAPFNVDVKEALEHSRMSSYEKLMLKVQTKRNLPRMLLKNRANILVLDLADEFMERWETENCPSAPLAVIEGKEEEYEKVLEAASCSVKRKYSPLEMDMQEVEEKIQKFAKDILYSEENPDGYQEKNVIVIEALYTPDIMGNDGNLHKHDGKYRLHEYNEWLRKAYLIFYKYFQNCKVIKMPEFTHSSQNHIRGTHPLNYMQDTYFYFERALDVLCGYSHVNTVENLFKEQSLKNKLETRVANSSAIYEIEKIKNKIDSIEDKNKPLKVNVYGSCIARDIFRYTFPNRYQVVKNIERIPISCLYQEPLPFPMSPNNYEERMFSSLINQDVLQQIKESNAQYLIIDLAEERLDRFEITYNDKTFMLPNWTKVKHLYEKLENDKTFKIARKVSPFDIGKEVYEKKFKRFAQEILKSEKNPNGFPAEKIIILEAYYAEKIIDNNGRLRNYNYNYDITKYNQFWKQLYSLLNKFLPGCNVIKLPLYTYASENHMWGPSPLHYTEGTYLYFAKVMDHITNKSNINTLDNLYREQILNNKYLTRELSGEAIYSIPDMNKKILELQMQMKDLVNKIQNK